MLPLDPGVWLGDAGRSAPHEVLRDSEADVAVDRLIDSDEILSELRSP